MRQVKPNRTRNMETSGVSSSKQHIIINIYIYTYYHTQTHRSPVSAGIQWSVSLAPGHRLGREANRLIRRSLRGIRQLSLSPLVFYAWRQACEPMTVPGNAWS